MLLARVRGKEEYAEEKEEEKEKQGGGEEEKKKETRNRELIRILSFLEYFEGESHGLSFLMIQFLMAARHCNFVRILRFREKNEFFFSIFQVLSCKEHRSNYPCSTILQCHRELETNGIETGTKFSISIFTVKLVKFGRPANPGSGLYQDPRWDFEGVRFL